jgi:hypothetical protein
MQGAVYVGDSEPVQTYFARSKATQLLAQGNDFALVIIALVVGSASLLLFFLTGRRFYIWYSLYLLLSTLTLPMSLFTRHNAWGYFSTTYMYVVLDWVTPFAFWAFILSALGAFRKRLLLLLALLNFLAEMGPILYIHNAISRSWADANYFIFATLCQAIVLAYLIRGWRRRQPYARLLVWPFAIPFLIGTSGNLARWFIDLNVPHASALLFGDYEVLNAPFTITIADLGGIIATLGLLAALVYQFAQSSREEQRLKTALQTAHDIQHSLVPADIPRIGGLHTEIVYLAAEEVGGDFCQILPRAGGDTLIVIGDVSGKGLQAAMLGTLAVGALRSMADEAIGPAETLARLNSVLLRTSNKGFITCLCMVLTPTGHVTFANAGHLPPYLNGVELPTAAGLPLGIVPHLEYEQSSLLLSGTARLTLLSDGVVEARSETGELYGFERTCGISHLSAKEIAATANSFGQEDDITVITLDWISPGYPLAVAND